MNRTLTINATSAVAAACMLFCLLMSLLGPMASEAQTTLAVPLDKSAIAWDYADQDVTSFAVTHFSVTCNGQAANTAGVTRSIPVKQVVPGPGIYECTVAAVNQFGASPNSAPVVFEAGTPPPGLLNLRIEVR